MGTRYKQILREVGGGQMGTGQDWVRKGIVMWVLGRGPDVDWGGSFEGDTEREKYV